MRIVLCYPVEPRHLRQIAEVAPHAELVDASQERVAEELREADIFCGHAKVPVPWDEIVARGRLRWIQSTAAGIDHCLTPSVADSDILVTGASGLFADQVAEQTLALLLGLLRGLPTFFRQQQARQYVRRPTGDLHGATVGIVGFGGNGRRVAEILAAFRTRLLATDMFPERKPNHVQALWEADKFEELLPLVDVLVLCVPLTAKTRGMVNARTLSRMKSGALLINVARGQVVVERDLIEALVSGQLGGVGTDVNEIEPLPPESRLWELPHVIITPHVGAQSARRIDDATDLFCENLGRYLRGEPLWNVVDKELGFPRPTFIWTPKKPGG